MVKQKKLKNLKTVAFDEEIVTKESADRLLLSTVEQEIESKQFNKRSVEKENGTASKNGSDSNNLSESNSTTKKKSKRKKLKTKDHIVNNGSENQESNTEIKSKRIKRKLKTNEDDTQHLNGDTEEYKVKEVKQKRKKLNEAEAVELPEVTDEVNAENPKIKKGESIREQKRKKHAKLLEEKRLKGELATQQNVLNYLSKWKHCRNEWKFEKLKQIWLQQNLFDISKIPSEFWEIVVEYFSGSKGFIRNVVLRDALKIIDQEESAKDENTDDNYLLVLNRARDIVQNLQE